MKRNKKNVTVAEINALVETIDTMTARLTQEDAAFFERTLRLLSLLAKVPGSGDRLGG